MEITPPPAVELAETKPPLVAERKIHSAPPVVERKGASAPAELGRGGAQHKAIQKRLKQAAEKLGFRSMIEKEVLEGQGSVDLLLEGISQTFACEISIATTIDHEVHDAVKCLIAGFANVVVICVDAARLKKIEAAIAGSLGADLAAQVTHCQPDEFIARLQALPPQGPPAPEAPVTRGGYKITRSVAKLTQDEQRLREKVAIQAIAAAMRKKV
jgi:hypothetical protein